MTKKKLSITLIKSKIGIPGKHKSCLLGLGLHKINHSKIIYNTAENIGMVRKVRYLLDIKEVN